MTTSTELNAKQTQAIKDAAKVISGNRLVSFRIVELENMGYNVSIVPMGPGGVGQVKHMANGQIRIQIGYSMSCHNHASAVTI